MFRSTALHGSDLGYWDAQGNVVASYVYDAFGRTISESGPMADVFPFRFSTKYFDVESGLYYYGYRFYSPEDGRWLTRDPLGEEGGPNLYAFCGNNAVSNVDSVGLFSHPLRPNKPDLNINQIPQIMRANGMFVSARLMERWLCGHASKNKNDETSIVTMDWVLSFARAKVAYDEIFSARLYDSINCRRVIESKIRSLNPRGHTRFCDLSRNVRDVYKDQVTYKVVGSSYSDPVDDLSGSLGRFTLQVAVSADIFEKSGGYCVIIDEIGVFVRDQYDFNGIQPLGYWNPETNYVGRNPYKGSLVENGSFERYRQETGMGGDFYVYSDVKRTKLDNPIRMQISK